MLPRTRYSKRESPPWYHTRLEPQNIIFPSTLYPWAPIYRGTRETGLYTMRGLDKATWARQRSKYS